MVVWSEGMDQSAWGRFVAEQEIIVLTRFSYFGLSGWKSEFSRDPGDLFEKERLRLRLQLLRAFPLASLAAQTDQNFHLFVLCSRQMPDWALRELRRACRASLPAGRYTIAPRGVGVAANFARRFLQERVKDGPGFQIVLDDDDALACDFLQRLRGQMARLTPPAPDEMRFVSFGRGYALDLKDLLAAQLRVYRHKYPFINLGLAMVGPADGSNLLSIAHRKTPREHEHAVIGTGNCMFLRCVHGANDSRVAPRDRWKEVSDWRNDPDIRSRFAFMTGL